MRRHAWDTVRGGLSHISRLDTQNSLLLTPGNCDESGGLKLKGDKVGKERRGRKWALTNRSRLMRAKSCG